MANRMRYLHKRAITKEFSPNIRDRLKMNISLNPNFTVMVTVHGKTRVVCVCARARGRERERENGDTQNKVL